MINKKLLPIKAHYLFFMAAMGPILPQLPVYGKELGISPVVMGTITGLLPIVFLLAKPLFGMVVDVYRNYRKFIFMMLIVVMTACFALINFVPPQPSVEIFIKAQEDVYVEPCTEQQILQSQNCSTTNQTVVPVLCESRCFDRRHTFLTDSSNFSKDHRLCYMKDFVDGNKTFYCDINCTKDIDSDNCLYSSTTFWFFVILMSLGSIGFNVANSISDAICFDVIGETHDYGKQRVWGTIGFGISAVVAGYAVDFFSGQSISYTPAFVVMLIFSALDIFACIKLKLPIIESPENIFKDIKKLLNNRFVATFITYAVFAGILDSFIIYYLFWYLEDLAHATQTTNIKLLEGLIVAAETLGGEVIFFSVAGKILERIGHVHCFSMCFINYALRFGLISVAPTPWWVIPIEFVFQGPTYALTYTTVVEYANKIAPPGASATMQGIAAGMDDGFGYAVGSFLGGILYKYIGGRNAMQVFSCLGVLCSVSHMVLHKTLLKKPENPENNENEAEYKSPEEAIKATYDNVS